MFSTIGLLKFAKYCVVPDVFFCFLIKSEYATENAFAKLMFDFYAQI